MSIAVSVRAGVCGRQRMDFTSATQLLSYHRGMLADEARTAGFQQAIREVVKPGDIVVDLARGSPAGLGIASCRLRSAGISTRSNLWTT
jgi:hypothetical protein